MPPAEPISEPAIKDHITRAVSEVFTTMLGQNPGFIQAAVGTDGLAWPPLFGTEGSAHVPHVVGTVGFIGEVNGLIYLYLPDVFARIVTGKLLGLDPKEIAALGEEGVNDAIGEITNMTVGVFKNSLCDSGYSCRLTIPSILRGSNFHVEPISSATRRTYYFDCAGHRIVADILMKFGE
jgi:chemotaxis protein CheX